MPIEVMLAIIAVLVQVLGYIIMRAITSDEPDVEVVNMCNTEPELPDLSIIDSIKIDLKEQEIEELRKIMSTPCLTVNDARDILGFTYIDVPKTEKADKQGDTYICPCCGTTYIAGGSGFIPNCTNCGARLEKER